MIDPTPLRNMLLNLLDCFDSEVSAENSCFNYHAVGLTYLNLLRTRSLTVKLYLTEPNVVQNNEDGFLVNPHSHRYNFETHILTGWLEHFEFEEFQPADGERCRPWFKFNYNATLPPQARFARDKQCGLLAGSEKLNAGDSYYLQREQIHTIRVAQFAPTLQLQIQYYDADYPVTHFYGRVQEPPKLDGLYQRMTPAQAMACYIRVRELTEGVL